MVPDSVVRIENNAFSGCSNLKTIKLPNNMIYLGCAFSSCNNLKEVIIPNGITSINTHTFLGCVSLESIVIPQSVTSIGLEAFGSYTEVSMIYYMGSASDWSAIEILRYNENLSNANLYFYTEAQPIQNGYYWHYIDGVPTPW